MKEVEELTVEAIDWITEGIKNQGGQSGYLFYDFDTCRSCAIGSIGHGVRGLGVDNMEHGWVKGTLAKAIKTGLAQEYKNAYGFDTYELSDVAHKVSCANTYILKNLRSEHDKERGTLMLEWLQAQRDMKCSSWVPPVKELSAEERRNKREVSLE